MAPNCANPEFLVTHSGDDGMKLATTVTLYCDILLLVEM
jgi:hypothetical protein